jgi:SAM-dependent methyltransferase/peroxiredoxin
MTRLIWRSAILAMLVSACGFTQTKTDRAPKEGDPAPPFSITTDHGKHITPEVFGGNILVLNFWETSCVPCVKEMPSLSDFARRFQSEHVVVVAIGGDEDARKYRQFLRDHQIALETYRDSDRRISRSFGTYMFPETYIIQDGRIIRKVVGAIDWMSADITAFVRSRTAMAPTNAQSINPRDREFWNSKFSDPKTQFNREPSRLLVEAIRSRPPGRALDLGMGEGRNAIFLAQQGWKATGVDLSDVAVAQAKARAAELHLDLTAIVDNVDHYDMSKDQWDLITLFYMHAWYHGAKPASAARITAALKPGGLVVIEGFAGQEKFMFQPNELLRDFSDLRILRYEDIEDEAEWAPGRRSHIIRLVAEKMK